MTEKQTRRHFLKAAGGIGLVAMGTGIWGIAHYSARQRIKQNIIVIVIDTLRRDALGCYGNPVGVSPRIDAIAEESVRFNRAISSSGWTLPSIASLLTGAWPTIHGALGKGPYQTPLRSEVPTAAEIFKKNRFKTLGIANVTLLSPTLQLSRGFDVYDHQHSYDWKIRRADETIDTVLKMIRKNSKKSNFVFIHIFDPHINYDPPPGYKTTFTMGRREPAPPLSKEQCIAMQTDNGNNPPSQADIDYIKGVYYGEVNFVDVHIGRLVEELKEMDIYDDSTMVITSDHGEEFWEHGGFEHGHAVFDELTRVPLIIKLPSTIQPVKHIVQAQVRTLDVMPTLFNLAEIGKPPSFVGQSLIPFIMGQTREDQIAFSESTCFGSEKKCLRTEQYTYIYDLNPRAKQKNRLYDWRVDPYEKENLVKKLPVAAMKLGLQLEKFYNTLSTQAQKMSKLKAVIMDIEAKQALESLGYVR